MMVSFDLAGVSVRYTHSTPVLRTAYRVVLVWHKRWAVLGLLMFFNLGAHNMVLSQLMFLSVWLIF